MKIANPRPFLSDEQWAAWNRVNLAAFDKLPATVRECLRDTGVEADCGKLLEAIFHGVPEQMVVDEIMRRAPAANRLAM